MGKPCCNAGAAHTVVLMWRSCQVDCRRPTNVSGWLQVQEALFVVGRLHGCASGQAAGAGFG